MSMSSRHDSGGHEGCLLFDKELTVRKSSSKSNYLVENTTDILKFELTLQPSGLRRELVIRINDTNDPFCIYHCIIDHQTFERLKQEQGLFIDFERFPNKVVDLLERCHDPTNTSMMLTASDMRQNPMQLRIEERKDMGLFIHLKLTIPAATDEYVKHNFSKNYRKVLTQNDELLRTVASLEEEISSLSLTKSKDLQTAHRHYHNEKDNLESQIREMNGRYREDRDRWIEAEKAYKAKLSKLQLENANKDQIIGSLERDAELSESDRRERYKSEMTRKNGIITDLEVRNKELLEDNLYQKELREEACQQLKVTKTEFEEVRRDLSKANEIIRKLQAEVNSSRDKVGILNRVTHKQEDQIERKDSTVGKLEQDLSVCLQQLKSKNAKVEHLEEEIHRLKQRLSQADLQATANKKVISNLSKELDQQIRINANRERLSPVPKTTIEVLPPTNPRKTSQQAKPPAEPKLKHVNVRQPQLKRSTNNRNVMSFN